MGSPSAPTSCAHFSSHAPVWTLHDTVPLGVLTMAQGMGSRSTDHTWQTVGLCGYEGGQYQ